MHQPIFALVFMRLDAAVGQIDREAVADVVIIEEVTLDDFALVAEGDDELVVPEAGKQVHDVPEHRLTADLDHRLGLDAGLFLQPRAESARQNCHLHGPILWNCGVGSVLATSPRQRIAAAANPSALHGTRNNNPNLRLDTRSESLTTSFVPMRKRGAAYELRIHPNPVGNGLRAVPCGARQRRIAGTRNATEGVPYNPALRHRPQPILAKSAWYATMPPRIARMRPMTKFILIDHSLQSVGGHHFEYALHVLRAAERAGFDVWLAANRKFQDIGKFPEHWKVRPLYQHSTYTRHRFSTAKLNAAVRPPQPVCPG